MIGTESLPDSDNLVISLVLQNPRKNQVAYLPVHRSLTPLKYMTCIYLHPPNATLVRAVWSVLDGVRGLLKGNWEVLASAVSLVPWRYRLLELLNAMALRETA